MSEKPDSTAPCLACKKPARLLLRRLKTRSPIWCEACSTVTSALEPGVRLAPEAMKKVLAELEAAARAQNAGPVLERLIGATAEAPFLLKIPAVQARLAEALIKLRRELGAKPRKLLPIALAGELQLVDPADGKIAARLPHMQAGETLPVALGFADGKVYYQEPGELSLTAHPLLAGKAWRTPLDSPVKRWFDAGSALLVETEKSLSGISGGSGRVRWSVPRSELGGLDQWDVCGGQLAVAGGGNLYALDPAEGKIGFSGPLPKKAKVLTLVRGSIAAPAALVDQGYGPGVFAPKVAEFKGGVKPVPPSPDEVGVVDPVYLRVDDGQLRMLWDVADLKFSLRAVVMGPLEKKFAAKSVVIQDGDRAIPPELNVDERTGLVLVPGKPVTVVRPGDGEVVATLTVDGRRGLRRIGELWLAVGEATLTALSLGDKPTVAWELATAGLTGMEIAGWSLAPPGAAPR